MTREEKSLVIDNLTAQLADNNVIYVTDLTGLNAQDTTALRRACFKANIKLAVVKNTLAYVLKSRFGLSKSRFVASSPDVTFVR